MIVDWYTRGVWELMSGTTLLSSHTIKALLVTSSYSFADSHETVSQITNEVTGGGYARQTLAGKSVVKDITNGEAYFDFNDLQFLNLTATIAGVILFRDPGTGDANCPVLCRCRLPSPVSRTAANLDITVPANGLPAISVRQQA